MKRELELGSASMPEPREEPESESMLEPWQELLQELLQEAELELRPEPELGSGQQP